MTVLWVEPEELDDPYGQDAMAAAVTASSILWSLSGRKYGGVQTVTEEYDCSRPTICRASLYRRYEPLCSAHRGNRVKLHGTPVRSVSEVTTNWDRPEAAVIPPEQYQIVGRMFLRPTYGATWRVCTRLKVTYEHGVPIPDAAQRAARVLANQLVKARTSPDQCELPDRVTSVSRQGISMTILDPQDFLKDGRTGIYEVDLFLKSVNPDGARKRSRVFSPDVPRGARVSNAIGLPPIGPVIDGGSP